MKVLNCNYEYYLFPEGVSSLEEFVDYVNRNFNAFIPMIRLRTDNCISPYFIEEDKQPAYVNFAHVPSIIEQEAEVMPRKEYDVRLEQAAADRCPNCSHYREGKTCICESARNYLCLDGHCYMFEEKESS